MTNCHHSRLYAHDQIPQCRRIDGLRVLKVAKEKQKVLVQVSAGNNRGMLLDELADRLVQLGSPNKDIFHEKVVPQLDQLLFAGVDVDKVGHIAAQQLRDAAVLGLQVGLLVLPPGDKVSTVDYVPGR